MCVTLPTRKQAHHVVKIAYHNQVICPFCLEVQADLTICHNLPFICCCSLTGCCCLLSATFTCCRSLMLSSHMTASFLHVTVDRSHSLLLGSTASLVLSAVGCQSCGVYLMWSFTIIVLQLCLLVTAVTDDTSCFPAAAANHSLCGHCCVLLKPLPTPVRRLVYYKYAVDVSAQCFCLLHDSHVIDKCCNC